MAGKQFIKQFTLLSAVYTIFTDGSILQQVVSLTPLQQQVLETFDLPLLDIYLYPIRIQ